MAPSEVYDALWQEMFGVTREQGAALIGARSLLADDLERAFGFWARPQCEDGGWQGDPFPPFGWLAVCGRLESLEALERTFPRMFDSKSALDFAEGC